MNKNNRIWLAAMYIFALFFACGVLMSVAGSLLSRKNWFLNGLGYFLWVGLLVAFAIIFGKIINNFLNNKKNGRQG